MVFASPRRVLSTMPIRPRVNASRAAETVWGGLDERLGRIDAPAPRAGYPDRRRALAFDARNGDRETRRSGRDTDRPLPRLALHPAHLHRQPPDHGPGLRAFGHLRGSRL